MPPDFQSRNPPRTQYPRTWRTRLPSPSSRTPPGARSRAHPALLRLPLSTTLANPVLQFFQIARVEPTVSRKRTEVFSEQTTPREGVATVHTPGGGERLEVAQRLGITGHHAQA